MSTRDQILNRIPLWRCLGYYGYGQGAALREFNSEEPVCTDICPFRGACWNTHKDRVDRQFPKLAQIRQRAVAKAQSSGKKYEMADYAAELSKDVGHVPVGNEAIDPWIADNAVNINNGIEGNPADRRGN